MTQGARSRKGTARSLTRSAAQDAQDLSRFVPLAREGLETLAKHRNAFEPYFEPIDELRARYAPQFEPDDRFVEYAKAHAERYLDLSRSEERRVGKECRSP